MTHLFPPPPADPATLTARQRAVWEALEDGPLTTLNAGYYAHLVSNCSRCTLIDPCQFASTDGLTILRRLKQLGLARERARPRRFEKPGGYGQDPREGDIPY
jgi:hypothetical protein